MINIYYIMLVVIILEVITEFDMDFDLATSHLIKIVSSCYMCFLKNNSIKCMDFIGLFFKTHRNFLGK